MLNQVLWLLFQFKRCNHVKPRGKPIVGSHILKYITKHRHFVDYTLLRRIIG